MKINIISDLHCRLSRGEIIDRLDEGKQIICQDKDDGFFPFAAGISINQIKPGDVLVIAGDLGVWHTYKLMLSHIEDYAKSQGYSSVIFVLGNHDFYGALSSDLKAMPLGKVTRVDNVSFVCSTGWSPIYSNKFMVSKHLCDYRYIKGLTINDINDISNNQYRWIIENVKKESSEGQDVVVVTHHLPLFCLVSEKYRSSCLNEAFAVMDPKLEDSILDLVYSTQNLKVWAHGHSHDQYEKKIANCRFIRNPIGYAGENSVKNINKIIKL